jgi:hypothetical protein
MKMHVNRTISAALGAAVIFGLHLRNGWWLDDGGHRHARADDRHDDCDLQRRLRDSAETPAHDKT